MRRPFGQLGQLGLFGLFGLFGQLGQLGQLGRLAAASRPKAVARKVLPGGLARPRPERVAAV